MAVSWNEAHQADGSFTVDVDNRPDILEAVAKDNIGKVHLCFWEDGELKARYLVRTSTPSRGGIKIAARSLASLLGKGTDGPTLIDREFIAGNNLLNNGGFELFGADALDPLNWKLVADAPAVGLEDPYDPENPNPDITGAGDSRWTFGGDPHSGHFAAIMLYLPTDDDKMVSDDVVEYLPPGSKLEVSAMVARGATAVPGRIRLRVVYGGLFRHPNQIRRQGATIARSTDSTYGDIDRTPNGKRLVVNTHHRQMIADPSFGPVLTGWTQQFGSWGTVVSPDGNYVVRTAGGGPAVKVLAVDPNAYPGEWYNVTEGEEYFFDGWIGQEAGTDGTATVKCLVSCFPADPAKPDYWETAGFNGPTPDLGWYPHHVVFTIREGYNLLSPQLHVENHTTGAWLFDNVHMWRQKGNIDAVYGTPMVLAPKRTYRWRVPFHTEGPVTGTVQLRAVCYLENGTSETIQGTTLHLAEDGVTQLAKFEFETPSGCDVVQWGIHSEDVRGGSFWIGDGDLVDVDSSTIVRDCVSPGAPYTETVRGYAPVSKVFTTPRGATSAHLEVIAEAGAFGYVVDDVSLRRVDAGPILVADVIRELLKNPHTGEYVLNPGTIHPTVDLAYDVRFRNRVLRDALNEILTTGQAGAALEYRVNADRTYDVGRDVDLFTDRSDVILRRGQIRLLNTPESQFTIDEVIDEVRVIGAERMAADKIARTIQASYSMPLATTTDAFGRPLRQTRTITDSGVDNYGYAALRAALELHLGQQQPPSVSLEITDPRAYGTPPKVGDWLYVYDPEADLVDFDNEMADPDTGETIWPMRLRYLDRTGQYSEGGNRKIELCQATAEAGEGLDITDAVRWSEETTQQLTIGTRKPEFLTNPAGGNPGDQLRRMLASSPQ